MGITAPAVDEESWRVRDGAGCCVEEVDGGFGGEERHGRRLYADREYKRSDKWEGTTFHEIVGVTR